VNATLRPLQESDADISVRWRNDSAIRDAVLGYKLPVTLQAERDWISHVMNDQGKTRVVMAVEDSDAHILAGYVYLNKINWIDGTAWFGIMIGDTQRQSKGIGRSAAGQMFDYALNKLSLRKLCVEVAGFNSASLGFFRALKFEPEGVLKKQIYLDNKYHDLHIFSCFLKKEA
jgi:RimJ/RimL family protein N-acetyltransferase